VMVTREPYKNLEVDTERPLSCPSEYMQIPKS
jgi:hypothetical protein